MEVDLSVPLPPFAALVSFSAIWSLEKESAKTLLHPRVCPYCGV